MRRFGWRRHGDPARRCSPPGVHRVHRHRRAGPVDPARATSPCRPSRSASSPATRSPASRCCRRATARRRPWGAAAVGAAGRRRRLPRRQARQLRDARRRAALRPRRSTTTSARCSTRREVRAGLACGPITFPNYRLVPDTRWMLDAPRTAVGARSAQRRERGVAVFTIGRETLRRYGFADGASPLTNVPDPGFAPLVRVRAPQRVLGVSGSALTIPSSRSRSHSGAFWCSAVCSSAQARSSASGPHRVPAAARSAATHASGSGGGRHRLRPGGDAGQRRRDRPPAEAGVLQDPVRQPGVVERLDLERHDPDVRAEDEAGGLLVGALPEPHERSAPRGTPRSPRRRGTSSSCHAPTSSSTSSGIRSVTARRSAQSVRRPRCPRDTATTVPPGSGAGKSSAESGTSSAVRPSSRSSSSRRTDAAIVSVGPLRGRLVVGGEPRAAARRRVVGVVEAVPAPVPELGVLPARLRVEERAGQRPLHGVEDDDDARPAASEQRAHEALGGPARDDVGHRRAASAATRRTGRPGDPRPRRRARGADPAPGRAG